MRKVKYKNSIGQELFFDNCGTLFVESIDTEGLAGRQAVEQLAFVPGQKTLDRSAGARTIPCEFAVCDRYRDGALMETVREIFSPIYSGILTVITEQGQEYSIEVTPSANVQPKQTAVPYIYKMAIDFVADDPFWRRGGRRSVSLSVDTAESVSFDSTVVIYTGTVKSPLYIHIAANEEGTGRAPIYFQIYEGDQQVSSALRNQLYIKSGSYPTEDIYIDCETLEIRNAAGEDRSIMIDSSYNIDSLFLTHGKNLIRCAVTSSGATDINIGYYRLHQGVPKW